MAYAQLSHSAPSTRSTIGDLWDLARRLLLPVRQAHRRLLLRQQLESLSDRLLSDVGIERGDLPALLRR